MLYALVEGEKTMAAPNLRGHCPGCLARVIPKCGEIKRWHFAHEPIYEEETVSNYRTFRWKWPQRSLQAIDLNSSRLFFDCSPKGLFQVKEVHWDALVGGWGNLFSRQEFLDRVLEPGTAEVARR